MSRTKIKQRVLEAMGFERVKLEEGGHYHQLNLPAGIVLVYAGRTLEMEYLGSAIELPCRGEEHLKSLIQIL